MDCKAEQEYTEMSDVSLISSKPTVSVLMITYNHEDFIAEAIENIVNQTTNFLFELVIGEDCSTDKTRQVVLDYQKKYPEIIRVIYSQENVGVNNNFSRTLYACNGKYVAICEGDDYWNDVTKLKKQVDYLELNKNVVVTFHDAYYLSSYENGEKKTLLNDSHKRSYTSKELVNYSFMPTLTMCFRNVLGELPTEFFKVVNADTFLISLLGEFGGGMYINDIKPAMYREHEGGIWSGLESKDKKVRTITTCYWMMSYYSRSGKTDVASHYACTIMSHALSSININKLVFVKWFLGKLFGKVHLSYVNARNFIKSFCNKKV